MSPPHQPPEVSGNTRKPDEESDEAVPFVPGAPIEKVNPLGREVTILSAVMLNLGQLIGSGIYSTPGIILDSVGSIGLLFVFWILAPMFAYAGLLLYTELASMFPNRSGAEVVYLEQAYPRPRLLVPIAFAVTSVLLSFSATNSIVFAQYVLTAFDVPITAPNQTAVAIGVCTFAVAAVGVSTKWSLRAVNFLTFLKVMSLIFIVGVGALVLLGFTRITDQFANFHDLWEGSASNPNSLATALVKTNHAFFGWQNAFNVVGEVKGSSPVRTVRKAGVISLSAVAFVFFFVNVAYVAAIPREEMQKSGQLVAALFFRRVFGHKFGTKMFPMMVACSCFSNIIAVTVGQARVLREVARQGLLPYPSFFTSTKPFGTPLAPAALKYFLTIIVILALPANDAFQFLLDLASYPSLVFNLAMCVGVWILRRRRTLTGIQPSRYQAHNIVVCLNLLITMLLLVMPWVPPEPGHSDVSFWYATYCVVGLGILLMCGLYHWLWIVLLPKLGGYEVEMEVEESDDGARNTRLVRRYKPKLGPHLPEQQPLLGPNYGGDMTCHPILTYSRLLPSHHFEGGGPIPVARFK